MRRPHAPSTIGCPTISLGGTPEGNAAGTARGRLRRAWTEHLGQYEWSHFATLTTRFPMTAVQLRREFEYGYVRRLARIAQGAVPWFCVVEHGATGTAHVHALLACTETLGIEQMRAAWRLGFTHVEAYDWRRGAAFYLTKELEAGDGDASAHEPEYDVSRRQPSRRISRAA